MTKFVTTVIFATMLSFFLHAEYQCEITKASDPQNKIELENQASWHFFYQWTYTNDQNQIVDINFGAGDAYEPQKFLRISLDGNKLLENYDGFGPTTGEFKLPNGDICHVNWVAD